MKRLLLPAFLISVFALSACSVPKPTPPQGQSQTATPTQSEPVSSPTEPESPESDPTNPTTPANLTRTDQQGMVVVEVTPLNLESSVDTIEFDVTMETHSVDLSMNLATLSTLTTDTGITVQATLWDAPRGGHHVSGRLIFPATLDGKSILNGATKLTLTIHDVDIPSRVFEWQLQ
jgi:hypothetical protein